MKVEVQSSIDLTVVELKTSGTEEPNHYSPRVVSSHPSTGKAVEGMPAMLLVWLWITTV